MIPRTDIAEVSILKHYWQFSLQTTVTGSLEGDCFPSLMQQCKVWWKNFIEKLLGSSKLAGLIHYRRASHGSNIKENSWPIKGLICETNPALEVSCSDGADRLVCLASLRPEEATLQYFCDFLADILVLNHEKCFIVSASKLQQNVHFNVLTLSCNTWN